MVRARQPLKLGSPLSFVAPICVLPVRADPDRPGRSVLSYRHPPPGPEAVAESWEGPPGDRREAGPLTHFLKNPSGKFGEKCFPPPGKCAPGADTKREIATTGEKAARCEGHDADGGTGEQA